MRRERLFIDGESDGIDVGSMDAPGGSEYRRSLRGDSRRDRRRCAACDRRRSQGIRFRSVAAALARRTSGGVASTLRGSRLEERRTDRDHSTGRRRHAPRVAVHASSGSGRRHRRRRCARHLLRGEGSAIYDQPFFGQSELRREPIGVCALFVPFNFPLFVAGMKLASALAMGNTAVLKPSPLAPSGGLRAGAGMQEAGIPPGVVNVVSGGQAPSRGAVYSSAGELGLVHRIDGDRP